MNLDCLTGKWIGDLRGTIVANLYVQFVRSATQTDMVLRANASGQVASLKGPIEADGEAFIAHLVPDNQPPASPRQYDATFSFDFVDAQQLRGTWRLDDGNEGIFSLGKVKNISTAAEPTADTSTAPLQIVQRTRRLPKFTIYRDELRDLARIIKELVSTENSAVVRSEVGGSDIRRYEGDFWSIAALPRQVPYFHISLNDPQDLRSINLSLTPDDCSFTVSSGNEMWTNGAFFKLDALLARRRGLWRRAFERYGLSLNLVALLLALVLAPSLDDLLSRFALVGSTIILVFAFKLLHSYATRLRILVKEDFTKSHLLDVPRLVTTVVGAGIVGLVVWAYQVLSGGGLRTLLEWLSRNVGS